MWIIRWDILRVEGRKKATNIVFDFVWKGVHVSKAKIKKLLKIEIMPPIYNQKRHIKFIWIKKLMNISSNCLKFV